jgi:hypothetical protein
MGVRVSRVDSSETFEIACDDCGEVFTVPSIHELLRWLPAHLYLGHEELSGKANKSPSKESSNADHRVET